MHRTNIKKEGGMMKKMGAVIMFLFLLTGILVIPALSATTEASAPAAGAKQAVILEPVKAYLAALKDYLPNLGVLLLILVIGSLAAVGAVLLTQWVFKAIQLEKGIKKIKIPEILKKGGIGLSLSELIAQVIFFLIIIATLIAALEYYGLSTSSLTGQLLVYIPSVIAAVFILIVGILLAILICGIVNLVGGNVRIAQSALFGNIAKYAIIVVSGLLAAKVLGLGQILTDKSKDIIFAGLVLGLALAFGLGAKERGGKFLDSIFKG